MPVPVMFFMRYLFSPEYISGVCGKRAGKYRILHKVLMIFIIGRKKKFYKLQNLDRGADFVYSIKDIKKKGCRSVIGNCYSRDMCCR